jgi:hypothetical protein
MSRSFTRRKKSIQESESRPSSPLPSLLRRSSKSSNSDDSRSARSATSGNSAPFRGIVNRLRSVSNASLRSTSSAQEQSQPRELKDAEDWFYGFQAYSQLVTTKIAPEQSYLSSEFAKATKSLTKNCGGEFIHGLPEAAFDFSLLWCPAGPITRKDSNEPSWSWTGHSGPVNFPFDPTSCPDLPRGATEWFRSEITQYHIGPTSAPYTVRREKRSNAVRVRYPPYFHAPRGTDATTESHVLRFAASTISAAGFTAEQLSYNGTDMPCSQLLSPAGKHCGVIMDREAAISEPSSTGPYEFVLLSRNLRHEAAEQTRRPRTSTMHPPGTPVWDGERFVWDEEVVDFDDDEFESGPWKMMNVMLIRWNGEFAERVAIARIHEDAWMQQEPVRKEIVLQ